jgi:hypothetical protein
MDFENDGTEPVRDGHIASSELANMGAQADGDVRFTPENGNHRKPPSCPLSANSDITRSHRRHHRLLFPVRVNVDALAPAKAKR